MTEFITLYKKEVRRFVRVIGQTVGAPIINSSLYLLIFGVSLGNSIPKIGELNYLAFLIPGLIMMAVLNNSFQNSSSSIITSKFHGDLQDLRVMPLSTNTIIWAFCFGGLTRGLLVGSINFFVGQIFYYFTYGQILGVYSWPILILFLCIGGLCFAKLGICVAFWASNFDQQSAIANFVLTPLIYLGGVFFSLEHLHPFWIAVSKANPLFYFINGVRYGVLGQADVEPGRAIVVASISLIVLHIMARRSIKNGSYTRW